jgi:hypothetical protein
MVNKVLTKVTKFHPSHAHYAWPMRHPGACAACGAPLYASLRKRKNAGLSAFLKIVVKPRVHRRPWRVTFPRKLIEQHAAFERTQEQ